jgi:hypothetical protein
LSASDTTPQVGEAFTVVVTLNDAPPFASWSAFLSFDNTKLELTGRAAGSFSTFIPDRRGVADINATGEVRSGGLGLADNAGGNGTLGVFTFKALAAGSTRITTANPSAGNPFGNVLSPMGGGDVLPNVAGPLELVIGGSTGDQDPGSE